MSTKRVSPIATAWRAPLKNPATMKKRRTKRRKRTWSHGASGNRKVQVVLPCIIVRGEPITIIVTWCWHKERTGERRQEKSLLSVPFLPINTFYHLLPPLQLHDLPIAVMCEPTSSHLKSQPTNHLNTANGETRWFEILSKLHHWLTVLADDAPWLEVRVHWRRPQRVALKMLSYAPLRSPITSDGQEKLPIKDPRVSRLADAYQRWIWSSTDPAFK